MRSHFQSDQVVGMSVYVQCALLPSHNRFATFRVTWIGASVFVCPSIVRLIEHISSLFKCTFFNAVFFILSSVVGGVAQW